MLTSREELRELRSKYSSSLKEEKQKILVCAGTGCISSGSLEIFAELQKILEREGINCSVELQEEPHENSVGLKKSGCHGFCEMGPLLRIEPQGYLYVMVKLEDCIVHNKTTQNCKRKSPLLQS